MRYGGRVNWLFGAVAAIASRDTQVRDDGVALLVRLAPRPEGSPRRLERRPVEIGVRVAQVESAPHVNDLWVPLEQCSFDAGSGLEPPGLEQARRGIAEARWRLEESRRVAREAEEAAAKVRAEADARMWSGWTDRQAVNSAEGTQDPTVRRRLPDVLKEKLDSTRALSQAMPGTRPSVLSLDDLEAWDARHQAVSDQLRHVLRVHGIQYLDSYPEWVSGVDGQWAEGLPERLVDPAWAALHRASVVFSAPVDSIADPFVDREGVIVQLLVGHGFITLSDVDRLHRYQSTHRPGLGH